MYQYIPLPSCKPNQIICGYGQAAVITGWTVKESVAKHLTPIEYAAIGQLYSPTRGISFLVRNLLANPHVCYVVLLSATKADRTARAVECLSDFFNYGVELGKDEKGADCWLVRSPIVGYIDIEISENAIALLRQKIVNYPIANSVEKAVGWAKQAARNPQPPWGEPMVFPEPLPPAAKILPGPLYGHLVRGRTIAETWIKILHRIRSSGIFRKSGWDSEWQELIVLVAIVTDEPPKFYFPDPNYLPASPEFVSQYISQILDDAPKTEGTKYSYGQRLRSHFGADQIEQVIQKLAADVDAASAVMNLWDVTDHNRGGSPCLNHIWVRVVNNELSLTATFRSNDMFGAWPLNAMGLRALQQHVCDRVSELRQQALETGPLIIVSQSAHVYGELQAFVDKLLAEHYPQPEQFADAVGNFLIELGGDKIVVVQTAVPPKDSPVAEYSGKSALKIVREICSANPAIAPSHAAYLGVELYKAERALQMGVSYLQDC